MAPTVSAVGATFVADGSCENCQTCGKKKLHPEIDEFAIAAFNS